MKSGILGLFLSLIVAAVAASPWSSHGPVNGTITRVVVAASDPNIIYAAAPDGLFRSRDTGASWTNITGPIASPATVVLGVESSDVIIVGASNGVFRSEDGGTSWKSAAGLPLSVGAATLVANARNANVIYVAGACQPGAGGIYKSIDGGRTFTTIVNPPPLYSQLCIEALIVDPLAPDRLYQRWTYAELSGAARTDDGGRTWIDVSEAPHRGPIVGVAGGQRYAIGSNGYSLLRSTDGVAWSPVQSATGIESGPVIATRFTDLALDPLSGRLFLGASNGAYRSGDGGVDWLRLEGPARDAVNDVHYDPTSSAAIIATDFGLFQSIGWPWNDWTDLHVGNAAMPMREVIADPSDGAVYALSGRHLFRSADLGATWQLLGDALQNPFSTVTIDAGHALYSSDYRGGVYHIQKLTSEGQWREIRAATTFSGLVPDPHEPGTLYSLELESIARTRDGGGTWERLQLPPAASPWSLVVDSRNAAVLTATTFSGIVRSRDGGRTWSVIPTPEFSFVTWIAATPSNPDVLYAKVRDLNLSSFQLAKSTDAGASWSLLPSQPAPGDSLGAVAIHPGDPETLFVATLNRGVFTTRDGGASWQSISEGLPDEHVFSLTVDPAGAFLHAATSSRGVWELPLRGRVRAIRQR